NQYYVAALQPPPPHLKAMIPWEGFLDFYRDFGFWGGIPETNFTLRDVKPRIAKMPTSEATKAWSEATDPVGRQVLLQTTPKIESIRVPVLICAAWSSAGTHTRGAFEVYRRIGSKLKWLYNHGGAEWDRFYSEDALTYQKRFLDHYLKGVNNGWEATPPVRV